jgi:hypothetical protein
MPRRQTPPKKATVRFRTDSRLTPLTPTKLMKSYEDAGYFGRNLRAIEVLIDQEKVRNGVGAAEAWKFYDLGHGTQVLQPQIPIENEWHVAG